jgi:hypothetical protein
MSTRPGAFAVQKQAHSGDRFRYAIVAYGSNQYHDATNAASQHEVVQYGFIGMAASAIDDLEDLVPPTRATAENRL